MGFGGCTGAGAGGSGLGCGSQGSGRNSSSGSNIQRGSVSGAMVDTDPEEVIDGSTGNSFNIFDDEVYPSTGDSLTNLIGMFGTEEEVRGFDLNYPAMPGAEAGPSNPMPQGREVIEIFSSSESAQVVPEWTGYYPGADWFYGGLQEGETVQEGLRDFPQDDASWKPPPVDPRVSPTQGTNVIASAQMRKGVL